MSDAQYEQFLKEETARAVRWQEDIGLDVLVHGEFERNDMVQYFGEHEPSDRLADMPAVIGAIDELGPITDVGAPPRRVRLQAALTDSEQRIACVVLAGPSASDDRKWRGITIRISGDDDEDASGAGRSPAGAHRGRAWEPSEGSHYEDASGAGGSPAGAHRGRAWEPSRGFPLRRRVGRRRVPRRSPSRGGLGNPPRVPITKTRRARPRCRWSRRSRPSSRARTARACTRCPTARWC